MSKYAPNIIGDKPRVRFNGAMVKPETITAIKDLKVITQARSDGAVLDAAIENYAKKVSRKSK